MSVSILRYLLVIQVLVLLGCGRSVKDLNLLPGQKQPLQAQSNEAASELQMHFQSVTSFYVRYGETALLFDPFVSWNPLLRVAFGKLQVDSARVDSVFPAQMPHLKGVVVGHSHYDHLMDLPALAPRLPVGLPVYGNASVPKLLASYALPFVYRDMTAVAWQPGTPNKPVWQWAADSSFRLLPIVSKHAPHFCGLKIAAGSQSKPKIPGPQKSSDWVDGGNLTYLIDFMQPKNKTKVVFRLFFMDSVSEAPNGIPPAELLAEAPVDLAMIAVAIYKNAKDYPQALLNALKPKHVMVIHWEDFMRKADKPLQQVSLTNVPKFLALVKELLPADTPVFIPTPNNWYKF